MINISSLPTYLFENNEQKKTQQVSTSFLKQLQLPVCIMTVKVNLSKTIHTAWNTGILAQQQKNISKIRAYMLWWGWMLSDVKIFIICHQTAFQIDCFPVYVQRFLFSHLFLSSPFASVLMLFGGFRFTHSILLFIYYLFALNGVIKALCYSTVDFDSHLGIGGSLIFLWI